MQATKPLRVFAAALAGAAMLLGAQLTTPSYVQAQTAEAGAAPVTFEAILANGGPRLSEPVKVAVWSLEGSRAKAVVARAESVPAQISLSPGNYRLVATYGSARRIQEIEVTGAEDETHLIDLRAGQVGLTLRPSVGERAVQEPMEWRVHRYLRGAGKGDEVAKVLGDRPSLLLREGWYQVEVDYNGETVGHLIEVGAGRTYNYTLLAR